MNDVYLHLLVEGYLDEQIVRKIMGKFPYITVMSCLGKRGKSYIGQNIQGYNRATLSPNFNCFCLIDLDQEECPIELIHKLLPEGRHADFMLRIAVREVEAWLIADRQNLAQFLGVSVSQIPQTPDKCPQPKAAIISAARKSTKRDIKRDLLPVEGSGSSEGKNYTSQMLKFITQHWDIDTAVQHSESLRRAIGAIQNFQPTYK